MTALLDTCDDCTRHDCGARYCENADGPVCPWCKDDPEVEVVSIEDFEMPGSLAGTAYVNAEVDPRQSTIELQVGRGFRSLTFTQAAALGAWLLEATGEVGDDL